MNFPKISSPLYLNISCKGFHDSERCKKKWLTHAVTSKDRFHEHKSSGTETGVITNQIHTLPCTTDVLGTFTLVNVCKVIQSIFIHIQIQKQHNMMMEGATNKFTNQNLLQICSILHTHIFLSILSRTPLTY